MRSEGSAGSFSIVSIHPRISGVDRDRTVDLVYSDFEASINHRDAIATDHFHINCGFRRIFVYTPDPNLSAGVRPGKTQTCGKIGPETKKSCIDIKSWFGTVFDDLNP